MYKDTLMEQWENLCSDCAAEYDLYESRGEIVNALNRWYEARIHRWSSISYPEGIILEQQKNPAMSEKLKEALKNFRFEEVKPDIEKPAWVSIVAGVAAGVICSGILTLLHWSTIKTVISGVIVAVAVIGGLSAQREQARKKEKTRVKEAYINQLRKYQKTLLDICGD